MIPPNFLGKRKRVANDICRFNEREISCSPPTTNIPPFRTHDKSRCSRTFVPLPHSPTDGLHRIGDGKVVGSLPRHLCRVVDLCIH